METTLSSRSLAVMLTTALAPIAWGSGYYVTDTFLPPDRPLYAATVRALPFGLLLLVLRPRLPTGVWWLRASLLGVINVAAFFVLVFETAYRLPGGLAATLQATSPVAIAVLAWWLLNERPRVATVAGALVGLVGVGLLVLRPDSQSDPLGVVTALGSVGLFALGSVLTKRWRPPVDLLTLTSWQLVAGGLLLLPVALAVEGPPPAVDVRAVAGFLYIGVVGTVLAYALWIRGIQELPAASISLVGLLNPVAGSVIGVTIAGEAFGFVEMAGTALVFGGIVVGSPLIQGGVGQRRRPRSSALAVPEIGPRSFALPSRGFRRRRE